MSKWFKSLSVCTLSVAASVAAAAAVLSVKDVNDRVRDLLAPFNSDTTQVEVVFSNLDVNDTRVEKFGVEAGFLKTGKVNSLKLTLPAFSYVYEGPRGLPYFEGKLQLDMDLLKTFPHSVLNEIGESAEEIVNDTAKGFAEEYGDAAVINAKVDELLRDGDGNVVAMSLHIDVQIDLAKLPEKVPVEDVPVVSFRAELAVNLQGAQLSVSGDMNSKYRGFAEDQRGLKDLIEKLLNNDKETYEELQMMVGYINDFTEDLVNQAPKQENP